MSHTRFFILFCVVALLTIAAVGAWVAGSRIVSPAEAAARSRPPTPSPILVPVEQRVLRSVIVTRGTARYGLPQSVSIAPSALKTSAGLITTLPVRNTQLKEGDEMLTASGRPVFVLEGAIPAYRDLVPGTAGSDVLQLEQALVRLGHDPGDVDGTFDHQTSSAVARWYSASGWEPFGPTNAQRAVIRTFEQDLREATKIKLAAEGAVAAAALDVDSIRATAALADEAAAADVEAKTAAFNKAKVDLASAASAVQSARAKAEHANELAAFDVDAKIAARDKITADLASAFRAVETARAIADHSNRVAAAELAAKTADRNRLLAAGSNGTPLAVELARAKAAHADRAAAAEVVARIADRALVVLNPQQTRTARAAADAQVDLARSAAANIQLEGELAVEAARREANLAVAQFELAQAAVKVAQLEGERAVKAAIDVQIAAQREAALAEAQIELARTAEKAARLDGAKAVQAAVDAHQVAKIDVSLAARQLELAQTAVKTVRLAGQKSIQVALDGQKVTELEAQLAAQRADRLAADLQRANSKIGVQLPVDEIVFIPTLPVRIEQVTALVGQQASGPLMSVTDNQLAIDASLPLDAAPLVKPAMPVFIDERAVGIEAAGVVQQVAHAPGTHGVDGYHIYFEVRVNETSIPLEGFSLRLTIPIESTEGAVTAVPLSALTLAADGTSRVQASNKGALEYVQVEPGLSSDGFVEVSALKGELQTGQLVVVGFENYESQDLP